MYLLKDEGVPVIKNMITPELLNIIRGSAPKYRRFPLPKKRGGVRWISEPVPLLKAFQRVVLEYMNVPSLTHNGHEVINGFVPGRSILDNARPHVGQKVVLSMDIKDFFGNIRPGHMPFSFCKEKGLHFLIVDACFTRRQALPQGSPVSPMLANWAGLMVDRDITEMLDRRVKGNRFVKSSGWPAVNYTRYADDLTFSSDDFDQMFIPSVKGACRYKFADDKIHFMRSHKRQMVTGIIVNEKMSIPKERRKILRAVKHRIETKGIDSVENFNYCELMGELSYLHLTDKTKARDMIDMLLAL